MSKKIVIIGGVAAGAKTAAKLKRMKPDYEVSIYTQEEYVSYSACGLPYYISGMVPDWKNLIVRSAEKHRENGVNVFLFQRCDKICPEEKKVIMTNLQANKTYEVSYDELVITTGAKPIIPPIENYEADNVYLLRTLQDGVKIKEKMLQSKTVTIIGGGYIAIELLEAFIKNGLNVNIITLANTVMNLFDEDISSLIQAHILEKDGDKVKIYTNDTAQKFVQENGKVSKIITKNGQEIDTDFVVIAIGVRPNSDLAEEAGLKLGVANAISVDKHLQTSHANIWAAGDCAEKTNIITGEKTYIALGSVANKEGRTLAINLAGENEEYPGVLGSSVARYFGFTMSISGLTETAAKKQGYETISAIATKKDKAGYMPDAKNITVKLVADKKTGKLLGAQAIGCGDADKRVNSITTALSAGMTIEEFEKTDLTYTPGTSTAIDPLLNVTYKLAEKND